MRSPESLTGASRSSGCAAAITGHPPWQRLEQREVARFLGRDAGRLDMIAEASSTNTLLLQRAAPDTANGGAASGSVLAAELQTAGRGRMGRAWHSGLGTALTFSLLWRFDCGLNALSGLSLAVGVAQCGF